MAIRTRAELEKWKEHYSDQGELPEEVMESLFSMADAFIESDDFDSYFDEED